MFMHSSFVLLFGIGTLGIPELLLILLVVLLIFGAKKLPEIGSGLGKGIRGFKDSLKGNDADSRKEIDESGDEKQ
jgi:sec-independent protein translocase protein TatA